MSTRCQALDEDLVRCTEIHAEPLFIFHGEHEIYHGKPADTVVVNLCAKHREGQGKPYDEQAARRAARRWHNRRKKLGLEKA